MNQIFLIAADYLKGKSIYAPIRRLMNLLFNISITSFIYEKIYGHYSWLDYNDYKGILNFFVKGKFFVPLSIYISVYGLTQFISIMFFYAINHLKTVKWTREIISYEVRNDLVDKRFSEIETVSKKVVPVTLSKSMLLNLIGELKKELTPEVYEKIEREIKTPKSNIEATFHLCFRSLIAITIYFVSIPSFGGYLYLFVFITLLAAMFILLLAYRFLDIFPTLVRKFHTEVEQYLSKNIQPNNT